MNPAMAIHGPETRWETIMRFTPTAIVAAAMLVTVSSASYGNMPAPRPISEISRSMQAEGERLYAAGEYDQAIGWFETALAADPRNADAYIGLGRIAQAQDLPGKAVGYFREALTLLPDDRRVIAAQGEALVQRGAVEKARENLTRLQTLCGESGCPEATGLSAAISAAGAHTALRAEDVMPQPTVESAPTSSN
jgi:tetratricopeptide (TPR) repeat protein